MIHGYPCSEQPVVMFLLVGLKYGCVMAVDPVHGCDFDADYLADTYDVSTTVKDHDGVQGGSRWTPRCEVNMMDRTPAANFRVYQQSSDAI